MASTFISSSFPSFLPFTLFTSRHIKCKPTYLDFASTNFFSSALPYPNDHAFYFFLFFLPSNVYGTSLTLHNHLCGLTFVHPFINVVGLLYIIEEKMNLTLLFRTSFSSNPISLCWLLSTCPTSSFNELRQSVGWKLVQRTQQNYPIHRVQFITIIE